MRAGTLSVKIVSEEVRFLYSQPLQNGVLLSLLTYDDSTLSLGEWDERDTHSPSFAQEWVGKDEAKINSSIG